MKICFYGVGGVGGYYAALLTQYLKKNNEADVYFIARGAHRDQILNNGLLLKKDGGKEQILVHPHSCTDTVDDLPIFDIVVVSVKGYDLETASRDIKKITDDNSVILPLLNGADIYERMRQHLSHGCVFPACLYVSTHIESPGVIFQTGGNGQIALGTDPEHPERSPEKWITLFKDAGIPIDFFEDVNIEIWKKYIFIAPFALVTATFDKTMGEVVEDPDLGVLVQNIMEEVYLIAGALNVFLPSDIVETSFSKARQFPFETKTSLQRDVETKGRQSEWDLFGGSIVRYAEKFQIAAPHTRETLDKLLHLI